MCNCTYIGVSSNLKKNEKNRHNTNNEFVTAIFMQAQRDKF